jgi:hypothetical protein
VKSNVYGLSKKEASRILSKCEQANRIEEDPFSASLSTDRRGNLESNKMPPIDRWRRAKGHDGGHILGSDRQGIDLHWQAAQTKVSGSRCFRPGARRGRSVDCVMQDPRSPGRARHCYSGRTARLRDASYRFGYGCCVAPNAGSAMPISS